MVARREIPGIDAYAERVVQHHARVLVRSGVCRESEREDAEQDLRVDLLQRLPRFDEDRATYRTFVSRVVRHRAARIAGAQFTEKARTRRATASLQDEVADEEGLATERWQTLPHVPGCRAPRGAAADELDTLDVQMDVARVLRDLPPELRQICEWLRHHTVTETARSLGVSRAAIWRRVVAIRERFVGAGLGAYVTPAQRALPRARE